MRPFKILLPIVVALVLCAPGAALACPNCKEAMANAEGTDVAGARMGYFWSILLMIGMPFGMLSVGAFSVVRAVKRGALPEM